MNKIIHSLTASVMVFSLVSCSLFSSGKQTIKIVANDPNATIFVNGEPVGKGIVTTTLKKNKSAAITAKSGNKNGVAVVDSELSTTGVLDIVGGCIFLLPFLGFCSGGAWQLEQETVAVNVN
ncbi:hypothetical protein [Akkermansia sp.]|uniref:hypothetical protein n=1 Tax=Akkermansia sp. TaxID=1872421 RepID=UPI0025BC4BF8|nr:hypothetical protein [Akkermansia sp.]